MPVLILHHDAGEVSIHSPRRSGGRREHGRPSSGWIRGFNPLPPPKRRETISCAVLGAFFQFQSTPPAEAEGDVAFAQRARRTRSFNPLPPPKRRETLHSRREPAAPGVSIHSPRRSGGRRS